MANIDMSSYDLLAVGEFSYGFDEIWEFRYKLLKKLIRSSSKKITLYTEFYDWQANNFTKQLYKVDQEVDCNNKMFTPYFRKNKFTQPHGELHNFIPFLIESRIYHKILKYMIRHHHRLRLIGLGVDKEKNKDFNDSDKDQYMYEIISRTYNPTHINMIWAHNRYIDNRKSCHDKTKWSMGHMLRQRFKTKYCIILSQAYEGHLRWCGNYVGSKGIQIWDRRPYTKTFNFIAHKKWRHKNTDPGVHYHIFDNFCDEFIEFGDAYRESHIHGYDYIAKSTEWDYVIFWNYVTPLKVIGSY